MSLISCSMKRSRTLVVLCVYIRFSFFNQNFYAFRKTIKRTLIAEKRKKNKTKPTKNKASSKQPNLQFWFPSNFFFINTFVQRGCPILILSRHFCPSLNQNRNTFIVSWKASMVERRCDAFVRVDVSFLRNFFFFFFLKPTNRTKPKPKQKATPLFISLHNTVTIRFYPFWLPTGQTSVRKQTLIKSHHCIWPLYKATPSVSDCCAIR